jgi:hypothetical protein
VKEFAIVAGRVIAVLQRYVFPAEARRFGVAMGTIWQALSWLKVMKGDMELYSEYSHTITVTGKSTP